MTNDSNYKMIRIRKDLLERINTLAKIDKRSATLYLEVLLENSLPYLEDEDFVPEDMPEM